MSEQKITSDINKIGKSHKGNPRIGSFGYRCI